MKDTIENSLQLENVFESKQSPVSIETFKRLGFQVGTIQQVAILEKARKPSYRMEVDFGDLGLKTTCGQLVENQSMESLQGKQVLGITNFAPLRIAGIKSEVLTLGFPAQKGGSQAIALTVNHPVTAGQSLTTFPSNFEETTFQSFLNLDIRSATLEEIRKVGPCSFGIVDLGNHQKRAALIPGELKDPDHCIGLKIAVLTNLSPTQEDNVIYNSLALTVPLGNTEQTGLITPIHTLENGFELF